MKLINNNITTDTFLNEKLTLQQYKNSYRVGLDTVLLASMIQSTKNNETKIMDLGAGIGGVSFCVLYRLNNVKITSIEKTKEFYELCLKNITLNSFVKGKYTPLLGDIKDFNHLHNSFDIVVINPPYYERGKVPAMENYLKSVANIESNATLQDFLKAGHKFLFPKGTLFLIQKIERIFEILNTIRLSCWGAVTLYPIFSYKDKPADRGIISMKKFSKEPFKITKGIVIHNSDGSYTKEALEIINGKSFFNIDN